MFAVGFSQRIWRHQAPGRTIQSSGLRPILPKIDLRRLSYSDEAVNSTVYVMRKLSSSRGAIRIADLILSAGGESFTLSTDIERA